MKEDIIDMIAHYRLKINNLHFNESRNGKVIRNDDELAAISNLLVDIIDNLNGEVIISSIDKIRKDLAVKLIKQVVK